MAHLEETSPAFEGIESRKRSPISPFYSRAYGGYTADQQRFFQSELGSVRGLTLLDPMAGQGFLLAELAYAGGSVHLGDINPAMCILASLRAPEMLRNHHKLTRWTEQCLRKLAPVKGAKQRIEYVDQWIAPPIRTQLELYRSAFQLEESPFRSGRSFWDMSLRKRFAAALPLLAARDLTCFRTSDNQTWIKPGGLQRETDILGPLLRALATWDAYAQQKVGQFSIDSLSGSLTVETMDAEAGHFGASGTADVIITSPPYANRLDYTRMWAPESEVAAALWEGQVRDLQVRQIGSNVIRGTAARAEELNQLPAPVLKALRAIRDDPAAYASKDYYYPFFRNYAISLGHCVTNLARKIKPNGLLIIFVRDTVRKDVLFPTSLLVEKIANRHGLKVRRKERKIVRHHVGVRRRESANGLYGIGQQEWWLALQRRGE
jgi:hypothetical protein